MNFRCYAACLFGLESIVAAELRTLELEEIETRDARVYFSADEAGIARANLCLSSADRVYLILGQFRAVTFDELFEQAKALPFEEFLPRNARFPWREMR